MTHFAEKKVRKTNGGNKDIKTHEAQEEKKKINSGEPD